LRLTRMSAHSKIVEAQHNTSKVAENPPADPKAAEIHFRSKLAFETDPSDVYIDLQNNATGIVVIDARTQEAYARGHVPGAISLPYRKIDSSTTSGIPRDKILVTYCDGVQCNASTKAALRLAALGFHVKEMLDGIKGWKLEGYPVEETVVQLSPKITR
jgi:rhodanese-related sulfurtransferase